jgi:hypothetical protein
MPRLPTIAQIGITLGIVQAVRGIAIIGLVVAFYWWRRRVYVRGVKEAYEEESRVEREDGDRYGDGDGLEREERAPPPAYVERV